MIGISGSKTLIAREFAYLLPEGDTVFPVRLSRLGQPCSRYLFCQGFLAGKTVNDLTITEIEKTWHSNYIDLIRMIDHIIETNDEARICVIGSHSGYAGSFDMAYAGAKAALAQYVENKKLRTKGQQLVGIAPHIILDSGMTQRRDPADFQRMLGNGLKRRTGGWLSSAEVARLAYFLLYEDRGNVCNTMVRITGGNW